MQSLFYLCKIGVFAILYYAIAHLGFSIEGGQRGTIPIVVHAGIALTGLLLFGIRLWPGIFIGSLMYSSEGKIPLILAFCKASSTSLEIALSAWLLKLLRFNNDFARVQDVLLFGMCVVIIGAFVGATVFSLSLLFVGNAPMYYFNQVWSVEWFSDGIGMLIITASLLVWRRLPAKNYSPERWAEWFLSLLCLAVISGLTLETSEGNRLVLFYLILPFALWSAVRFEQHGATLANLLLTGILLNGGLNRFYDVREDTGYILFEIAFMGITTFTTFLVAAAYTERRLAEESLYREKEQALTTLHSIADGVITTDAQGYVTYLNPAAEELTGWKHTQALTQPVIQTFKIQQTGPKNNLNSPVAHCLQGFVSVSRQSVLLNRDKQEIAIEHSAAPIRNRAGKIEGAIIVFHDISKEQHLREQLSHQASHDALTGLFNRREFEYQLSLLLNQAKAENESHSLLYLDLDQFKIINDTCGHSAGDALLKQLVSLLQTRVRGGDTFARLGGDEFGILLRNCPIERTSTVAEAFLKTVRDLRFTWEDKTFEITVSIGAIPINAHSESLTALMSKADLACYAAKEAGRNRVHVHTEEDKNLVSLRQNEMQWVSHILKAIEEDRLVLYRQKIAPVDERVSEVHCEILLRMRNDKGAIVPPGHFLPAAERYDLMPKIDRWIVHKVFCYLAEQPPTPDKFNFFAINLSGATINDPHFAQFIRDELQTLNVPTQSICFEVTETAAISSLTKAAEFMREMHTLGFRFALDDFGSGVSSFNYLKQLPVDYLKIDGGFVKDLSTDSIDRAIVEAINQIGHTMNLKTIAEWVEDEATLRILHTMGIDFAQGYGIAKPEPFL